MFAVFAQLGGEFAQARRIERRKRFAQGGQQVQRIAQGRKIARARAAQGDAGEDALDVAEGAEGFAQIRIRTIRQRRHRLLARTQDRAVAQRSVQPAPQQAPAHRGDGGIEHAEQGGVGIAVDARIQFEVAAGGRVHRDRAIAGFDRNRGQVRQPLLLRFLDIAEQGAGGGDGEPAFQRHAVVDAEAGEVVHAEELQQLATAAVGVEQPRRAPAHAVAFDDEAGPAFLVRHQRFRRLQAREFGFQRVVAGDFVDQEAAGGEVCPRDSVSRLAARYRQQQGVATILQQRLVGDRARGDDAHHLAFDQALARGRIADLFADRHRFAQRHQPREVAFVGVVRHAGHRDRLPRRLPALGQGDVEQFRRLARVVVEQFVEIAHAEEQQHVRMLRLRGEELAHQGRMLCGHRR